MIIFRISGSRGRRPPQFLELYRAVFQPRDQGGLHCPRLLHDLLEHKVLITAFFCCLRIPKNAGSFLFNHLAGAIKDADEFPGLSEDVPIVLWQYSSTSYVDGIRGHVDKSVFLDRYGVADIMLKK